MSASFLSFATLGAACLFILVPASGGSTVEKGVRCAAKEMACRFFSSSELTISGAARQLGGWVVGLEPGSILSPLGAVNDVHDAAELETPDAC
jgi:hypothetical protein